MLHDDVRAIVREELQKIFAGLTTSQATTDRWVSLKEAVGPLGYPSYTALHKDVQAGIFRIGKEVRDRRKSGAKIARLQINLPRTHKRLLEDPASRRAVGGLGRSRRSMTLRAAATFCLSWICLWYCSR